MVHLVSFRVGSEESLEFWRGRVGGIVADGSLVFEDPEGLQLELLVDDSGEPLADRERADIPEEHRIRGFAGARAYAVAARAEHELLEAPWGSSPAGGARRQAQRLLLLRRARRSSGACRPRAPCHHIAWASKPDEHEAWRQRVIEGGGQPTPVIDRFYFKSIYFREPSGVLFEIATLGPGFTADEPLEIARREALAAAELRAVPRPGREDPRAAAEPARDDRR